MRVVEKSPTSGSYRSGSRACEARGCAASTREGKAFCPEHVGLNRYAMKVMREIAEREAEDAAVLKTRTPISDYNTQGITAQAILQCLRENGTRTRARLCRELNIERPLLDAYAKALIREGLVHEGRTNRGGETLALVL